MKSKEYELTIHQTFVQNGQLWIHYSLLNPKGQGVHDQYMPLSDLTEGLNYAIYQSKFAIVNGTPGEVEHKESDLATNQLQTNVEPPLSESDPLPDPAHVHDFVLKEQESQSQEKATVAATEQVTTSTAVAQNSVDTEVINENSTIEPSAEKDLLPEVSDDEVQAVEMTNEEVNQKNTENADTLFGAMAAAEKNE